jgi:hypothetical protein
MKITPIPLLVLLVATLAWPSPALLAQTTWTADQLAERTVHRRAIEAIIWGIPVVNYDLMFQSFVRDAKGGVNQILYWSGLSDWKNQYLTPNPDTIYFMPFFSTKDAGPMVRIKLYPLSAAANPPATTFIDAINVVVTGVIPYDVRFFQSLDCMVQSEPWIERDRAMIDPLRSLGIEKGKPFQPEDKTADILKSAAQEALARFDLLYETIYEAFNKGTRWFLPADKDLTDSIESG